MRGGERFQRADQTGRRHDGAGAIQRHKHVINLSIWLENENDSKPAFVEAHPRLQFHPLTNAGMTFWAVSDLNEKELIELVQTYDMVNPLWLLDPFPS